MSRRDEPLEVGAVFGCYTVLREYVHGRHYGGRMYWVRCSCGQEGARFLRALKKLPKRCQKHNQAVAA